MVGFLNSSEHLLTIRQRPGCPISVLGEYFGRKVAREMEILTEVLISVYCCHDMEFRSLDYRRTSNMVRIPDCEPYL